MIINSRSPKLPVKDVAVLVVHNVWGTIIQKN